MGLVTPEEVSKMSEREIVDFIFTLVSRPADEVTEVSGRGVGMDVVKRNIERVNGQVSREPAGCRYYLLSSLTSDLGHY